MTIPRFPAGKALNSLLALALALAFASPSMAEHTVNWNRLGLSAGQSYEINRLENEWRQTYSRIQPQIEKDREELRRLLNDPNANEQQVMMIQSRLHKNEEQLRNEATRVFMHKKKILNPQQKSKLQEMIRH